MLPEGTYDLNFPTGGMNLSRAYMTQRPVPMRNGEFVRTTRLGVNVRAFDSVGRRRGGSRHGLAKYIDDPVVADWVVQELATIVGVGYAPPGATMQLSQSGRVVTLVAVSQGNIYVANPGDTAWTSAANSTGQTLPLAYSGIVHSTPLNQKLWFADGRNWTYYDPETNATYRWTATAGTLPEDSDGNKPRLIATWRGRIVLAGLPKDPANWFMSRVSTPGDFNYFPEVFTPDSPVKGSSSPLGIMGDMITALVPYSDDTLIMGGDHSIYVMQGDPAAGGQLDLVTNSIGMAWGRAYAMDPYGAIYFVSNNCGIYRMVPGEKPDRISQPIESIVRNYNTGAMTITMAWNDRYQGLHVFFTYTAEPAATTHLFWEQRSGAWWLDRFGNEDFNPLCVCTFDGNLPEDRATLIGSWDGYVRTLTDDAADDDGEPIESSVVMGPVTSKDLDEIVFKSVQAVLAETSGDVEWEAYVGATAEVALTRTPVASGTWQAGRNLTNLIRRSGHGLYLKLSASEPWAIEQIRAVVAGTGRVRQRGP